MAKSELMERKEEGSISVEADIVRLERRFLEIPSKGPHPKSRLFRGESAENLQVNKRRSMWEGAYELITKKRTNG